MRSIQLPLSLIVLYLFVQFIPSTAIQLTNTELEAYWKSYKVKHGKNYTFAADDYFRKFAFGMNLNKILTHNTHADLGLKNFKLSLNRYADQTPGEMVKLRTGLNGPKLQSASLKLYKPSLKSSMSISNVKGNSFDWRSYGIVNKPEDQGECGACWAFATAATVEGQWALSTGKLVKSSVQQLVDCSWSTGNEGCSGGNMLSSFSYLSYKPFMDGTEYPYLSKDYACLDDQVSSIKSYGKISSVGFVESLNETLLAQAVYEIGPIAVAIDASSPYLMFYWEGVYDDDYLCTNQINHAVTLVGYGTDSNGVDYWIVKNSWGPDWGDNGFFKMRRGTNMCGVAEMAIYPLF